MIKSKKGFTLVELIVVIAILAILAGMAIPAYSNYIKKARDTAVLTELGAIYTAAQAANATQGKITKVVVSADGRTIRVAGTDNTLAYSFDSDFCMFYTNAADVADSVGVFTLENPLKFNSTSYEDGAKWLLEEGSWEEGVVAVDTQTAATHGSTAPVNPPPPSEEDEEEDDEGTGEEESCEHDWVNATCLNPKTCTLCGTTIGTVKSHFDGNQDNKCDHGCGYVFNNDVWTLPKHSNSQ